MKIGSNQGAMQYTSNQTLSEILGNKAPHQGVAKSADDTLSKKLANDIFTPSSTDFSEYEKVNYTPDGRLNLPPDFESHRGVIEAIFTSMDKLYSDAPKAAQRMFQAFSGLEDKILRGSPELSHKDWGFSVNEQGVLVATGQLSKAQRDVIETHLNSNNSLVKAAQDFKAHFIEGLEMQRGDSGKSQYWGRYDVNNENFADIIDFKSMMNQIANANESKTGGFEWRSKSQYAWEQGMVAQLQAKAVSKFSA
ncbi:hypothetical protein L1077_04245 [Pseudoalteromonas luteoviolacea]|uniref:hypothetical protein n=1 Tax=Pseudoalteromonas luteoviolacea TaxID=43657 RepID=UPI001F2FEC58|nr:hypothetical protein [Pseudoalteromonas luteoviolacea]MCF6438638.1 hypothetical protein [Pseudoalteromonas luteoviolacea]